MQYEGSGALERGEPVPFRLTRNLATLFTPFGVEGVFITTMVAAAQVGDCASRRRCHTLHSQMPDKPRVESSFGRRDVADAHTAEGFQGVCTSTASH